MNNTNILSNVVFVRTMLEMVVLACIMLPMLRVSDRNRGQVKKILATPGIAEQLGCVKLTDADLMPVLKVDGVDDSESAVLTAVAVKLQRLCLVGKLFSGVFVMMITVVMISAWGVGIDWFDICLLTFTISAAHIVGQYIFVSRLLIPKNLSFSYGHSVLGKSFFAGNPLFGYKYFSYSKSLDKTFGLFSQKKDEDLK